MLLRFGQALHVGVIGLCMMGVGCSRQPSANTGYSPVRGKVLVNGQPAGFAAVNLIPVSGQMPAGGMADASGEFRLNTRGFNGAEPGEYLVTISWALPKDPSSTEPDFGPELLPAKYQDPKQSGLKIVIDAKNNVLPPFDLKP